MLKGSELGLLLRQNGRAEDSARQLRMERAARLVSEASERRARFLTETGIQLATLLDPAATVERIAELAVHGFADYCIIDLLEPDGSIERAAALHADERKQALMRLVLARSPEADGNAVARVIRTEAIEVETPSRNGRASSQVSAELVDPHTPGFQVIVPLRGHENNLGALTLGFGDGAPWGLSPADSAQAFARHAGLALERAYLFDETVAARKIVERASEATARFLVNISHELKTPLAAVIAYSEQLLSEASGGRLSETVIGRVRRIRASASHQLSLIEQILEYARFEGRRQRVRLETVDMRATAETAANLMKPEAQAAGVPIRLVLPRHPCHAHTDEGKLRQVLLNLLSNAVQFTESGEVKLELTVVGEHIVFTVIDSGVGISPDEIAHIFDRFYRGETTRPHGHGTGLGLNIARELVELLGGEIDVESQPGVGTSFRVRLPMTQPAAVRWARPKVVRREDAVPTSQCARAASHNLLRRIQ